MPDKKSLIVGVLSFLLGSAIFYVIGAVTLQNKTNKANEIFGLSQNLWDVEIRIGDNCNDKKNETLCKQRDDLSKKINNLIYQFENLRP